MKSLSRIVALILACATPGWVLAQDRGTPEEPEQERQDTAYPAALDEAGSGDGDEADTEDEEGDDPAEDETDVETPDTFIPTEEISSDNSVSFPVDI